MKVNRIVMCIAVSLGSLALLCGCGASAPAEGYYTLENVEENGDEANADDLEDYGLDEAYIVVDEDGDGYAVLFDIPVDFSCDKKKGVLDFDGVGKVGYESSGKKIVLSDSNLTMTFKKSKDDAPDKPAAKELVSYGLVNGGSDTDASSDSDSGSDTESEGTSDDDSSKDSGSSDASAGADATYDFYNGDWFGWWMIDAHGDAYKPYHGQRFDVLCRIDMNDDGKTGTIRMWDFGEYSYDNPFAEVEISTGDVSKGDIRPIKSESGYFSDDKIGEGDWVVDPAMYTAYSDYILIYDNFTDSQGTDAYDYYIHLKKWGADWEDFGGYPNRYDWYKNLVEKGKEMPETLPEDY